MSSKTNLILRIGVAFAFLYPPIGAFINPFAWIGFFPPFLLGIVPDQVLLHSFGIVEIIIGLWLLWGKNILIPSVVATGLLIGIVLFNLPQFDVVFRDLSIALMSGVLAMDAWNKKKGELV